MPELPEVETYVRELEPLLNGRTITHAAVHWPRTIAAPDVEDFLVRVRGQTFHHFGRRGKYMLLGLAGGDTLIVHLRMTGKLMLCPENAAPSKHTHVVLALDEGRALHYHDPRKFGRIWLVTETGIVLGRLGPEPLSKEFLAADLGKALAGRRASIKALLLNQSIIAGIGNIYADEALFLARIHPARKGGKLRPAEVEALHAAVQEILKQAIARRGSSLGDSALQNYLRPEGEQGSFQEAHRIFQRTGQPCTHCGAPVERIILAQRSTHYCPQCQR